MTTSPISETKQQDIFDLEKLADKQLEYLSEKMPINNACIQIIKNKQRYLVGSFGFIKDYNARLLRGIDHDDLINSIVIKKKLILFGDVYNEQNWSKKDAPLVRSWICSPLIVDNEVKGLLIIDHYEPNLYTHEKHEKLVEDFSRDVAGRIHQCCSSLESKRRIKQLETLIQIGNELALKIELNEDELFYLVEKYTREALNIQNVTISIINDAEKIYTVKASRDGEIQKIYTEDKNTKIYEKGWEPRNKNEGKGKIRYLIDKNRTLVLHAQCVLDEKDEDFNNKVLFSDDGKRYKFSSVPNEETLDKVPDCWIGVPIKLKNKVLGSISAFSWGHEYQLAAEYDSKILEALADKTAIALDNVRKYKEADKLNSAIEFTHDLILNINLTEHEILELIHKHASKVMDTDNMYVALYNEFNDEVRFSLVFEDGKTVLRNPRRRKTGEEEGKTEFIIRTKESLFHPTKKDSEQWYIDNKKKNYWGFSSPSWIGVPMLFGDKVLGVIATYHPTEECCYSKGDVKILQAIAESAAIALQNAGKYNKSEQWAFLGQLSSSIAHIIISKGGIIRLCIQELQSYFSRIGFVDERIENKINKIDTSNQYLLDFSDDLFKPLKAISAESGSIDVVKYLHEAQANLEISDDISINYNINNKLPKVYGNKYLIEVFREIMWNAIRAMEKSNEKKIIVDISFFQEKVRIKFSDTGIGILSDDKDNIFELFHKNMDNKFIRHAHKGFGLWWVRNFLSQINGTIEYEPPLNMDDRTVFIVELSVCK